MTYARPGPHLDRRHLLGGAAAVGLGCPLLAACGSGSSDAGGSGASSSAQPPGGSGSAGAELVAAADVPVGEGVILAGPKVVVTQPTQGDFKAFSAVCTHMGCIVSQVSDGIISCPCHGSQYSVKDGSVVSGPAPKPLPAVAVQIKGGEVVRA